MTGWGVGSSVRSSPTTQSFETAETVVLRKRLALAGIFEGFVAAFPSLRILTVSVGGFWRPVSAAKNSVPGGAGFELFSGSELEAR
jgi:hypothetical protein